MRLGVFVVHTSLARAFHRSRVPGCHQCIFVRYPNDCSVSKTFKFMYMYDTLSISPRPVL